MPVRVTFTDLRRFLWASLQLDLICRQSKLEADNGVKEALKMLPQSLEETYARILHKFHVSERTPGGKTRALRALAWVAFAARPLRLRELRTAIAVEHGQKSLFKEVPGFFIELCDNLLIQGPQILAPERGDGDENGDDSVSHYSISDGEDPEVDFDRPEDNEVPQVMDSQDPDGDEIQFFHYSVKEFLFPNHATDLPFGLHPEMANTAKLFREHERPEKWQGELCLSCLTYLSIDDFKSFPTESPEAFESWVANSAPLLPYAITFWEYHLKKMEQMEQIKALKAVGEYATAISQRAERFQQPDGLHLGFLLHAHCHYAKQYWPTFSSPQESFGYYCHVMGASPKEPRIRDDIVSKIYRKLLDFRFCSTTTLRKLFPALERLLKSSGQPDCVANAFPLFSDDSYELIVLYVAVCTPLEAFIAFTEEAAIIHNSQTLFFMSVISGREDIAEFLLEKLKGKVKVNAIHPKFGTALSAAALGAIYRSSLAGIPVSFDMIRLLLKNGVDVNLPDPVHGTTLRAVVGCSFKHHSRRGAREGPKARVAVLQLLLARKADPNLKVEPFSTTLKVAWEFFLKGVSRSKQVLEILLRNNAKIDPDFSELLDHVKQNPLTEIHNDAELGLDADQPPADQPYPAEFGATSTELNSWSQENAGKYHSSLTQGCDTQNPGLVEEVAPPTNPTAFHFSAEECRVFLQNYCIRRQGVAEFFPDGIELEAQNAARMASVLIEQGFTREIALQLTLLTLYDLVFLLGERIISRNFWAAF
jgi:hypothetical protein